MRNQNKFSFFKQLLKFKALLVSILTTAGHRHRQRQCFSLQVCSSEQAMGQVFLSTSAFPSQDPSAIAPNPCHSSTTDGIQP
jgi:hypothetical protein